MKTLLFILFCGSIYGQTLFTYSRKQCPDIDTIPIKMLITTVLEIRPFEVKGYEVRKQHYHPDYTCVNCDCESDMWHYDYLDYWHNPISDRVTVWATKKDLSKRIK